MRSSSSWPPGVSGRNSWASVMPGMTSAPGVHGAGAIGRVARGRRDQPAGADRAADVAVARADDAVAVGGGGRAGVAADGPAVDALERQAGLDAPAQRIGAGELELLQVRDVVLPVVAEAQEVRVVGLVAGHPQRALHGEAAKERAAARQPGVEGDVAAVVDLLAVGRRRWCRSPAPAPAGPRSPRCRPGTRSPSSGLTTSTAR